MAKTQQQAQSRQQRKSRQIDKEAHRRFQLMVANIKKWPWHRRLRLAWHILIGR